MHAVTQFVRYGAVGVLTNGVGYVLYLALSWGGVDPKLAMSLLYAVGVVISFLANRSWSFRHDGKLRKSFPRHLIAYAVGYLINLILLWVGVDRLGIPHEVVQALAIVVVAAILFAMLKFWVFRTRKRIAV